jgi:hypothetical protein
LKRTLELLDVAEAPAAGQRDPAKRMLDETKASYKATHSLQTCAEFTAFCARESAKERAMMMSRELYTPDKR